MCLTGELGLARLTESEWPARLRDCVLVDYRGEAGSLFYELTRP